MNKLSTRVGEVHRVRVLKREYKGTYASVWFSAEEELKKIIKVLKAIIE